MFCENGVFSAKEVGILEETDKRVELNLREIENHKRGGVWVGRKLQTKQNNHSLVVVDGE